MLRLPAILASSRRPSSSKTHLAAPWRSLSLSARSETWKLRPHYGERCGLCKDAGALGALGARRQLEDSYDGEVPSQASEGSKLKMRS